MFFLRKKKDIERLGRKKEKNIKSVKKKNDNFIIDPISQI